MNILATQNVSKHFDGVVAIDNLSIQIKKTSITAIIGPNGSGKSTLVHVLTGMQTFDHGAVIIDKIRLLKIHPFDIKEYGLTRTFQEVRLFEQMTVLDNILVVLTERGVCASLVENYKKHHEKKAEEFLQRVGLLQKRNQLAVNLSYGQRKLLEIARALAMNSQLFFFDEPIAGLFPEMIKRVVHIMRELKAEGKTIVLIEHNIQLIREIADYIIVMDEGKLLAEGHPNAVLSQKDVIKAYLGTA